MAELDRKKYAEKMHCKFSGIYCLFALRMKNANVDGTTITEEISFQSHMSDAAFTCAPVCILYHPVIPRAKP